MSELDPSWRTTCFAVVDIEGNGQRPHDVVEVAVTWVRDGQVSSEVRSWLVRPPRPITAHVFRIHGISNSLVENAPTFDEIRDQVLGALGQGPVIGHHVMVDFTVLGRQLGAWSPALLLDTVRLSKRVLPHRGSYSLSSLVDGLELAEGLEGEPHRAPYDAVAAARVFVHLMGLADPQGELSVSQLEGLCGVPFPGQDMRQQSLF